MRLLADLDVVQDLILAVWLGETAGCHLHILGRCRAEVATEIVHIWLNIRGEFCPAIAIRIRKALDLRA